MDGDPGKLKRIGVLGGMGVEATIALMQRVHAATMAEDDKDHVPLFVDMNPQVPSRIRHLIEKDGPDPGPVLGDMAAQLEQAGAQALAMPCNTAHFYAHAIESRVSIPLLNMPKLACAEVARSLPKGAELGILASPATNSTGLFQDMLEQVGLSAIFPEDETAVLAAIRSIKKQGPTPADTAVLDRESAAMAQRGAAGIIVGCTEFSLISKDIAATVPVFDTLDVLVNAIIAFSGAQPKNPS